MKKKIFAGIVVLILVGAVIVFGLNRMIPKHISSFLKGQDDYVFGCRITNASGDETELSMQELSGFIDMLGNTDFYYDGAYDNRMSGNLYFIEFIVDNEGSWEGAVSMYISDADAAYVGGKQYRIRSENDELIRYLQSYDS